MALKNDGTVCTWGSGGSGQLGVGSTATHSRPVEVEGVGGTGNLTGIVAIAGGLQHSVAVDSSGKLCSWGYNLDGELGDDSFTTLTTPIAVYTGTGIGTLSTATPYSYETADYLTAQPSGTTQSFDAANEICASIPTGTTWSTPCSGTPPTGVTTYNYDSKGNRTSAVPTSGSATCNTYDQANRLTTTVTGTGSSCTSPTTVGSYTHDGDDLRQSKTTAAGTTNFTWDESATLPLLLKENSTDYIYGPGGLPLEQINSPTTLYYHHDQLGSTRMLTDSSGAVAGSGTDLYSYDPYGNTTTTTSPTTIPSLGYAWQYTDAETGLIYLRARYYAPSTGQFLSRDAAMAMTRRPYAYAAGEPNGNTDPTGLDTVGVCLDATEQLGPISVIGGSCLTRTVDGSPDQIGVVGTIGGGPGAGADISGGVSYAVSNANSLSQLKGVFFYATIGGEAGAGASV